jgi:hypothetical protein
MFETLLRRVETVARRWAEARRSEMAERLRETLPSGIDVELVEEGVRLSGWGLLRRLVTEPGLAWLVLQSARVGGRKWE